MSEAIPAAWRAAIVAWAQATPRIAAVYLYGSRAKRNARAESDIDLAFTLTGDDPEDRFDVAMCDGGEWRDELQGALPVKVQLEFAQPDDKIVWPAVLEHGVLLFERR